MPYSSTATVSVLNCPENNALRARPYAPLGSSVWTSSGNLARHGITAIAQAASGTMSPHIVQGGEPTRASVGDSVTNSLALAGQQNRARLAIPFIGGGIFFRRIQPPCTKAELAEVIVQAASDTCGSVVPVIVAYDAADQALFGAAIAKVGASNVELVQGSITDHSLHKADVIVNAANMEVLFGGGISGAIGRATGDQQNIDAEAAREVAAFWAANPPEG